MLTPMFKCPKCGPVWRVDSSEIIDEANDEAYPANSCLTCGSGPLPLLYEDGLQVMHEMTFEEMQDESGYWDDF